MASEVPSVNLSAVCRVRDAIYARIRPGFSGVQLLGQDVFTLVAEIHRALPGRIDTLTIRDSVIVLNGQVLTDQILRDTAWRLAGCIPLLRKGIPVPPWVSPGIEEWCPVHVLGVRRIKPDKRGNQRNLFTLRLMSGTAAGKYVEKALKTATLGAIARSIGFTRRTGRYPYQGPGSFVGLRFMVRLDPAKASETTPSFFHIHGAPNIETFNRKILAVRLGRKPCPRQYNWRCASCAIGYVECQYAMHAKNYVRIQCAGCHQQQWADPDLSTTLCLPCFSNNEAREFA